MKSLKTASSAVKARFRDSGVGTARPPTRTTSSLDGDAVRFSELVRAMGAAPPAALAAAEDGSAVSGDAKRVSRSPVPRMYRATSWVAAACPVAGAGAGPASEAGGPLDEARAAAAAARLAAGALTLLTFRHGEGSRLRSENTWEFRLAACTPHALALAARGDRGGDRGETPGRPMGD